jgi:DNA-binding CsgD family transcriptional regulator
MVQPESVYQLIELIYEAATEPSRWAGFLEALSVTTGGGATILTLEHPGRTALPVAVTHGLDDGAVRSYADYYVGVDPFQQRIASESEGVLDFGDPFVPRRELERSEIFNDWHRPNGLGTDSFGGVVMRRGAVPSVIGGYQRRGSRAYGKDDLELVRLLVPHLKRALEIHYRLGEATRTAGVLLEALDGLAFGVILVGRDGRLVAVNRVARALAARKGGILLVGDDLRGNRPSETAAIRRLVGEVIGTTKGQGTGSGGTVTIRRPPPERPLELLVSPLRVPDSDAVPGAAAAIFLNDPDDLGPASEERLRDLYGLTPREAAVASRLSEGRTLAEVAEVLGISVNTVKVRLQAVFAKTGTHRQAELTRLLASHFAQVHTGR